MAISSPSDGAVAVNTPTDYTVASGVYAVQVHVGGMGAGDTVDLDVAVPGRDSAGTGDIYLTTREHLSGVQAVEMVTLGPVPVLAYDTSGSVLRLTVTRTAGTIADVGVRIIRVA